MPRIEDSNFKIKKKKKKKVFLLYYNETVIYKICKIWKTYYYVRYKL